MVPKWCPDVKNKVVKRKTATITRYKKSLCLQGFSQITYKKICGNTGRFWLFHDPRNQLYLTVPWVRIPPTPPRRSKVRFAPTFFMPMTKKAPSARPLAPPSKIEPAIAGLRFCGRPAGGFFCYRKNIDCNRSLHRKPHEPSVYAVFPFPNTLTAGIKIPAVLLH